jgi:mono/diheme cytochrome c family protein
MTLRSFFSLSMILVSACTFQVERILVTDDDDGERSFAGGPEVFAAECARCHGEDGAGLGELGPSLFVEIPKIDDQAALVDVIENGVFDDGEEEMPAISLSAQSQADVIEFVIQEFCPAGNVEGKSICDD